MTYFTDDFVKQHQEKMTKLRAGTSKQATQAKKKQKPSKYTGEVVKPIIAQNLLVLDTRFPSLNDYTNANRRNVHVGNKMKQTFTDLVQIACIEQNIRPINKQCELHFTWFDNGRRDPDNVAFAKKFICDGMVKAFVLKNDTWKDIARFTDEFIKCKKEEAKVLVKIKEVE